MLKFLLFLILNSSLLIVNCFAQQYGWIDISGNIPLFPYDTTIINNGQDTIIASLSDVHFINDNEGWIPTYHPFTDSAAILHTTDGGFSWNVQMVEFPVIALKMLSATEGYAASIGAYIYQTSNGGNTWNFHAPTFALSLSDLDFPPGSDTGYVCGQNGTIFRITHGGVEQMNTNFISDMKSICFVNPNCGWVCGQAVMARYSYGVWEAGHSYPSGHFTDVFFTDTLNGWATGMFLSILIDTVGVIHTSNDSSWFTQPLSIDNTGDMIGVFFLDNQKGWAVGTGGKIYSTINGGQSWMRDAEQMTQEWLRGVQFTSPTNGYVVGNNKTLLKYTQLTSVEDETTQPKEFNLEQNYPNPFNPSTVINYQLPVSGNVTLKVYDLLGREISTLVNEELPAGEYEVEFNGHSDEGQNLSSGVYFYQLKAGSFVQAKKMVLLR